MKRDNTIKWISENKIILILRGYQRDEVLKIADAAYKGGVRCIEVTFDQSGSLPHEITADYIRALRENFCGRLSVGAARL